MTLPAFKYARIVQVCIPQGHYGKRYIIEFFQEVSRSTQAMFRFHLFPYYVKGSKQGFSRHDIIKHHPDDWKEMVKYDLVTIYIVGHEFDRFDHFNEYCNAIYDQHVVNFIKAIGGKIYYATDTFVYAPLHSPITPFEDFGSHEFTLHNCEHAPFNVVTHLLTGTFGMSETQAESVAQLAEKNGEYKFSCSIPPSILGHIKYVFKSAGVKVDIEDVQAIGR